MGACLSCLSCVERSGRTVLYEADAVVDTVVAGVGNAFGIVSDAIVASPVNAVTARVAETGRAFMATSLVTVPIACGAVFLLKNTAMMMTASSMPWVRILLDHAVPATILGIGAGLMVAFHLIGKRQ